MTEVKIIDAIWFTPNQAPYQHLIVGIVLTNNGYEEKAYLGFGMGIDEDTDRKLIATNGARFNLEIAKKLMERD